MVRSSDPAYEITGNTASTIVASIELGIADGRLPAGAPLPPVRDLAATLGVNANTVAAAYRTLRDRGSVRTDGRHGTRVRDAVEMRARTLTVPSPQGARDLSSGEPDRALLPVPITPRCPPSGRYGEQQVVPELREAAATRLAADGVPTDHLLVTSGTLDGVDRLLRVHLRPGDAVAIEDPGWPHLGDLVASLALRPVPVPIHASGPLPDALAATLRRHRPRALVVTARAQNPTGAAITPERAAALRAVLGDHQDLLLIEDDHAADLVDVPLASLCGATRHWAYVRSPSKSHGPDLRLAVLSADAITAARVEDQLRYGARWVSHLLQHTLHALWQDPDTQALVRAARHIYQRRATALIEALAAHGLTGQGRTGLNVWVPVAEETVVVAGLLSRGWVVAPGAAFRINTPPAIRVTSAALPEDDAPRFAADLAAVLTAGARHPVGV
jgi:DNA-binding transcriptional MocR family regulator